MAFKADPSAIRELAKSTEVGVFLAAVGAEISAETEARAPDWIKRRGAEFNSGVRTGVDGREGYSDVDSSFWHMPEYGTVKSLPVPYIRPSAVKVLAKHGGRLEERGR